MKELEVGASRIGSLLAPETFTFPVPFATPLEIPVFKSALPDGPQPLSACSKQSML